ncbi:MAG: hypothetical protein KGP28_11560 [Bdellovibrionales bacterium]|nr:hypothetical protein [Bdellovibrionales bacterium]
MKPWFRTSMGAIFLITAPALSGCAIGLVKSLHNVSYLEQAPIPAIADAKPIERDVTRNVLLGFITNTDFVDNGWKSFQKLCPNGTIMNPMVRHSTDLGFLAYKEHLHFTGTCVGNVEIE